jgi:hypothetical protein
MATLAEELNALRQPGATSLTAPILSDPRTPAEPALPRVAVLLNAAARKVTPRVVRALSHVVPRGRPLPLAVVQGCPGHRRTILTRGYDTVFCGGGDGTFIGFADEILSEAERSHASAPRFGVLKLGTGTASRPGPGLAAEGRRRRRRRPPRREGAVPGYRPLELLKVEGRRAQFAGLGIDARLLNDYLD